MAALTNYHEFGAFNNTNLFVYSSRGCKSEVLFIKPKPGCWKGCVKRETLGKNPFPGPFQPLELHSWDYGHSVLQTQHLQTPSPPITISPPAFCVKSPISSRLWGHFWLHLGPTGLILDNLPISKILKLITSTKSRLPYEVSFRVRGSGHRFLWEPLFSLPPQPQKYVSTGVTTRHRPSRWSLTFLPRGKSRGWGVAQGDHVGTIY